MKSAHLSISPAASFILSSKRSFDQTSNIFQHAGKNNTGRRYPGQRLCRGPPAAGNLAAVGRQGGVPAVVARRIRRPNRRRQRRPKRHRGNMTPIEAVQRQLDAYNARNLEGCLSVYDENVKVYRPPAAAPSMSGRAALGEVPSYRALHAAVLARRTAGADRAGQQGHRSRTRFGYRRQGVRGCRRLRSAQRQDLLGLVLSGRLDFRGDAAAALTVRQDALAAGGFDGGKGCCVTFSRVGSRQAQCGALAVQMFVVG